MPLYRTNGTLTGTIEADDVQQAQDYLTSDDMTQYLDDPLTEVVEHIEWKLDADGHHWSVTAFTRRALYQEELKELAEWVSGQNSDGLGEGFEQQDFAWADEVEEHDCGDCDGSGYIESDDEDEEQETCFSCGGNGWYEDPDAGHMISFDWKTNNCEFVRVK